MRTDTEALVLECAIDSFLTLLRAGWNSVERLAEISGKDPGPLLSDWAQANWEAIVEVSVSPHGGTFLEPYGDGADCNPAGSRVWMAGAASTHAVYCVPRSGSSARDHLNLAETDFPRRGLVLDRFATLTADGWYAEKPPFDHALLTRDGREGLFLLSDVRFVLREIVTDR